MTEELERQDAEYLAGVSQRISLDDFSISMESGGCSAMAGYKTCVQKRISEQIHQANL